MALLATRGRRGLQVEMELSESSDDVGGEPLPPPVVDVPLADDDAASSLSPPPPPQASATSDGTSTLIEWTKGRADHGKVEASTLRLRRLASIRNVRAVEGADPEGSLVEATLVVRLDVAMDSSLLGVPLDMEVLITAPFVAAPSPLADSEETVGLSHRARVTVGDGPRDAWGIPELRPGMSASDESTALLEICDSKEIAPASFPLAVASPGSETTPSGPAAPAAPAAAAPVPVEARRREIFHTASWLADSSLEQERAVLAHATADHPTLGFLAVRSSGSSPPPRRSGGGWSQLVDAAYYAAVRAELKRLRRSRVLNADDDASSRAGGAPTFEDIDVRALKTHPDKLATLSCSTSGSNGSATKSKHLNVPPSSSSSSGFPFVLSDWTSPFGGKGDNHASSSSSWSSSWSSSSPSFPPRPGPAPQPSTITSYALGPTQRRVRCSPMARVVLVEPLTIEASPPALLPFRATDDGPTSASAVRCVVNVFVENTHPTCGVFLDDLDLHLDRTVVPKLEALLQLSGGEGSGAFSSGTGGGASGSGKSPSSFLIGTSAAARTDKRPVGAMSQEAAGGDGVGAALGRLFDEIDATDVVHCRWLQHGRGDEKDDEEEGGDPFAATPRPPLLPVRLAPGDALGLVLVIEMSGSRAVPPARLRQLQHLTQRQLSATLSGEDEWQTQRERAEDSGVVPFRDDRSAQWMVDQVAIGAEGAGPSLALTTPLTASYHLSDKEERQEEVEKERKARHAVYAVEWCLPYRSGAMVPPSTCPRTWLEGDYARARAKAKTVAGGVGRELLVELSLCRSSRAETVHKDGHIENDDDDPAHFVVEGELFHVRVRVADRGGRSEPLDLVVLADHSYGAGGTHARRTGAGGSAAGGIGHDDGNKGDPEGGGGSLWHSAEDDREAAALFPEAAKKKVGEGDENDEVELGAFNDCESDAALAAWTGGEGSSKARGGPGALRADPVAVASGEDLCVVAVDREKPLGTAMTTTLRYMPINCTGLVRLGRIALFSRSSGEYFHVGTTLQVVVVEKNAA